VQKLDAQLLLEQLHLPAERRLRDVELLGGAREVALPRDREEVPQAAKVHSELMLRKAASLPSEGAI
jgi:hypothetical protein